jgi:Disulphide bond corrector protein DsbC
MKPTKDFAGTGASRACPERSRRVQTERSSAFLWRRIARVHCLPVFLAPLLAILCFPASAQDLDQDISGRKAPRIVLSPPGVTTVTRGKPGTVELRFRVNSGFHVNSNTPKSEFLIPTTLKIDAPTDIAVGKITYPAGEEMSFPFSPDEKLSVYTGEFPLTVVVHPLTSVVPGKYVLRGELKYQACDNAACYPPKKLPVEFEVKVVKAPPPHRSNPAQSPHVHG